MKKRPEIFLSYSGVNKVTADKIDKTFSAIGIAMIRDERDLTYRGSIENFMIDSVRNHDYVLMLLSDDYLKSEYCMFEFGELMKNPEFEKKILPVRLEATNFFTADHRKSYYDFWDERIKKAEVDFAKYATPDFENQVKNYLKSRQIIANLFARLSDFKIKSFTELEASDYRQLFELIGIDKEGLLQKCVRVINISDEDEQFIAFDELQSMYPNNQEIDFAKALIYGEKKRFKAARKFNEDYIRNHTYDVHTVHYNLARMLSDEFKEYESAREHYEKAISIKPDYAVAHNNLGILLIQHFDDCDNARKHFENAIRSNPRLAEAFGNLGRLCKNRLHDYEGARENFVMAINIAPGDFDIYFLLAELAEENLREYNLAIDCYKDAIRINPLSFMAHYKLARLLDAHARYNGEIDDAVEQYRVSIMLNPTFVGAHTNLAVLLASVYQDFEGAKKEFEETLIIEPDNDFANYNLAVLLADYLGDSVNACHHYLKAIQKNPAQKSDRLDELCATLNVRRTSQ